MYFDDVAQIQDIASRTGAAVFVVPDDVNVEIPGAIMLRPEEKTTITIEQVRELQGRLGLKQNQDLFVIIRPAEKMQVEAANAFLKTLEEPQGKVHFVLITSKPSALLATVLSRCAMYFLNVRDDGRIHADEKVKLLAKRLMVVKPGELVGLAEEITKKKEGKREYALLVVGTAVEMLYKSYFLTGKEVFLKKLPNFLRLYENLERNGHIKLHLVADLV